MRISTKTISLMAGSLFAIGLGAGMNAGCGSSSSSDYAGTCIQACDKEISCAGDAAASIGLTPSSCMTECMQLNNPTTCSNRSTIASDFQACLKMSDCTAFQACIAGVPDCTGGATGGSSGTHTGGSSGTHTGGASGTGTGGVGGHAAGGVAGHVGDATGGTTGGAGNGGTADCSICDKATACCTAVGGGAACANYSAANCNASGAAATYASVCQSFLSSAVASGNAACQ
jgi:hypothetical protein